MLVFISTKLMKEYYSLQLGLHKQWKNIIYNKNMIYWSTKTIEDCYLLVYKTKGRILFTGLHKQGKNVIYWST